MTMQELAHALKIAQRWAEWDSKSLQDFHAYAQKFGCAPGANVYSYVLQDALKYRGITLEQLLKDAT